MESFIILTIVGIKFTVLLRKVDMKINEENVLKEMKDILDLMRSAYSYSKSEVCDRLLSRAIGKMDTLTSILSGTEED